MLIDEFQKNTMEKIRVSTENYKGHDFISIRVFYEDNQGVWKPTKKGISISYDKIGTLMEILGKINTNTKETEGKLLQEKTT